MEKHELQLGRGRTEKPKDIYYATTEQEARAALESDSPHADKILSRESANLLVMAGAGRTVARNLHRFPPEEHAGILDDIDDAEKEYPRPAEEKAPVDYIPARFRD